MPANDAVQQSRNGGLDFAGVTRSYKTIALDLLAARMRANTVTEYKV